MQFCFRYVFPIIVAVCGMFATVFSGRLLSLQGICCLIACGYVIFHILDTYVVLLSLPDRCSRSIDKDFGN